LAAQGKKNSCSALGLTHKIPCLSTFNHEVYVVDPSTTISDSDLLSCTKMYNSHGIPHTMLHAENYILTMSWSNPTCGSSETECYSILPHTKGMLFYLSSFFFKLNSFRFCCFHDFTNCLKGRS